MGPLRAVRDLIGRAEDPAEPLDVLLKRVARVRWRRTVGEPVQQPVGRHHPPGHTVV